MIKLAKSIDFSVLTGFAQILSARIHFGVDIIHNYEGFLTNIQHFSVWWHEFKPGDGVKKNWIIHLLLTCVLKTSFVLNFIVYQILKVFTTDFMEVWRYQVVPHFALCVLYFWIVSKYLINLTFKNWAIYEAIYVKKKSNILIF